MRRRGGSCLRILELAVVLALLLSLVPLPPLSPAAVADTAPDPSPPAPQRESVPPVTDPRLPSLTLDIAVAPDPVAIGQVATITVTVTNQAPDPAVDPAITLAPPAGAVPRPGDGFVSARDGWRWTPGTIGGR